MKVREADFSYGGPNPSPVHEGDTNLLGIIADAFLYYIQGLFIQEPGQEQFFFAKNGNLYPVYIVDKESDAALHLETYPRIVAERVSLQGSNSGGINNLVSLSWKTGKEKKSTMVQGSAVFRFYGSYSDVECIASKVFLSFLFLTEPLKYLTIYKTAQPVLGGINPFRVDSKKDLHVAQLGLQFWKEVSMNIDPRHGVRLRALTLRCSQVFDMNSGRARVRFS